MKKKRTWILKMFQKKNYAWILNCMYFWRWISINQKCEKMRKNGKKCEMWEGKRMIGIETDREWKGWADR